LCRRPDAQLEDTVTEIVFTQLANGLALGFIFVLVAVGLSIIFGMLGLVNFAHGAFFALSAYFGLTFFKYMGWFGVALAPVLMGIIGMVIERLLLSRAYGKEPLFSLILTFAIALMVEALIRVTWGSASQPFAAPEFLQGVVEYGPILLTKYRIAVVVLTIALLASLWAFLQFTPYGRILRAGARDPEMIGLLGINLKRVFTGVFGLGTFLAGVAGIMAAPLWSVTPNMSESAIMPAFVTVTIGGLGSYAGAVVAGLLVGVVTSLTVQFWPEASAASMYALMMVVLLLRPRGLFGERWERFE
jgi:branched-chain amino acid transport system permease protein